MRSRKPLAAAFGALMLMGSLVACSSGDDASSSGDSSDGKTKVIIISNSYQNQFYQAAFA